MATTTKQAYRCFKDGCGEPAEAWAIFRPNGTQCTSFFYISRLSKLGYFRLESCNAHAEP